MIVTDDVHVCDASSTVGHSQADMTLIWLQNHRYFSQRLQT